MRQSRDATKKARALRRTRTEAEAKLWRHLRGGQHAEAAGRDAMRTRILATCGYAVLHFWNHEVLSDLEGVLATIVREVALRTSDPLLVPSQVTLTLPSPTRKKRVGEDT